MKIDIWMPVYIGDYMRDTMDLTGPEHGAYLLLLMHYWQKRGEIGCDVKRLSIVVKSDIDAVKYVLDNYFILENGNYKNKRADREMLKANVRSEAGRTAANMRWHSDGNAMAMQLTDATAMPSVCSSSSSSSSSSKSSSSSSSEEEKPDSAENPPVTTSPKNEIIELPLKKDLSPMKDKLANHYQTRLTAVFPHEAWSDYAKERSQLSTLAKKTKALLKTVPYKTPEDLADAIIGAFRELKETGKTAWYRNAPFLPSSISTRWSEIIDHLARGQPDDNEGVPIEDLAEVF